MTALIRLTLDGSLVHENHRVSLRVLSHSMGSLQAAADRAFLDVQHGSVWKHAKLSRKFYDKADFMVGDPEEGSYVIDFFSAHGQAIVLRLRDALLDPYGKAVGGGDQEIFTIGHQIAARKGQVVNHLVTPQKYEDFLANPDDLATRTYGDKSINKEFDQMLTTVRRDPDALLKLAMRPNDTDVASYFEFNQTTAKAFKRVISSRQLGNPVIYRGHLRLLDHGHNQNWSLKGKFINVENDKDIVLHIQTEEDFSQLVPYLDQRPLTIVACPIIEYSSFDPIAGDIQFLEILNNG